MHMGISNVNLDDNLITSLEPIVGMQIPNLRKLDISTINNYK